MATSGGARAALDLSLLQACRLFPGQIVGVRGFNPTGGRIVARQVITHAPAAPAPGLAAAAMEVDGGAAAGVPVAVAAGPFATADDPVGFAPLDALLAALAARQAPPSMLVLLGPFVDVEQPAVAGGGLDVTFNSLFVHQVGHGCQPGAKEGAGLPCDPCAWCASPAPHVTAVCLPTTKPPGSTTPTRAPPRPQVLARISAWQERLPNPCQVVLLPSLRDAHAMPTFPQPPLDVPLQMDETVCLQNPALFDAGGAMVVAATSQDVLRHLAGSELQRGPHTDRIAALASHLLGQRR